MKKQICFKVNRPYEKNKLFQYHGDLNLFFLIRKNLEQKGFTVGTYDLVDENSSDYIIYLDYRTDFTNANGVKILLAMESIAALPQTFKPSYINKFDYIFTWHNELIDNKRIFPINYAYNLNPIKFIDFSKKDRLLCNFSANKFSNHRDELYSERINAIEYFNKHHPDKFYLFGHGWNNTFKYPKIYNFFKELNRYKITRGLSKLILYSKVIDRFILQDYSVYRGSVKNKLEELKKYKFSICFENVKNIEGYITEKIFDCFKSGVIPIYLGPKNIKEIIPSNTFIDMRDYKSYDELYTFISRITEDKYNQYIKNILTFLRSKDVNQFNSNKVAEEFSAKLISLKN